MCDSVKKNIQSQDLLDTIDKLNDLAEIGQKNDFSLLLLTKKNFILDSVQKKKEILIKKN